MIGLFRQHTVRVKGLSHLRQETSLGSSAIWHQHQTHVQLLLARGADLHKKNAYGADALGSALYGSVDCCDPDGGPGSLTHGDYAAIVELLLAAGADPPEHATGSEAVRQAMGVD